MPGLLVAYPGPNNSIDRSLFSRAMTILSHEGVYEAGEQHQPGFSIGRITGSPLGHSHYDSGQRVVTRVYGAIYPRRSSPGYNAPGYEESQSARYACDQYAQLGLKFVDQLNGEFNLVLWDKGQNSLVIANDRYGMRPWYVLRLGVGFVLSPEVKGLLPFIEPSPKLDLEILVGFLAFNKIRLADRTLIEGISVLPPSSLWVIDLGSGRIERQRYWQFRYSDCMTAEPAPDQVVDALVDCYREVMARRSQVRGNRRVGISLSGGLDSRSMVAALLPDQRSTMSAHTYGLIDSDEVQLARQAAESAGMQQYLYPLKADDFVVNAQVSARLSDELDIFVQGCQDQWHRQARDRIDVLMTGIDLDVTLGGIYVDSEVLKATDDRDVLDLLKRKNCVFPESDLKQLLGNRLRTIAGDAPYNLALDLLANLPQETPAAKYDLFINQFSMRRIIMLRYALIRFHLETASPMYDYDFMEMITAIPTSQRAGHRTFIPFLRRLSETLAAIPYQRTMLPATAPREFWPQSINLERQREQLYLDIWRETQGKVFIPYRRYYTNFDEWLRMNPAWIRLTDDLLQNEQAMLYQLGLVRPEYVTECIRQHRTGQKSRRQQIICLMSLELYLREYFA